MVQAFTKLFQTQKDDNWALYIMYVISLDIRLFAIKADQELANKGAHKPGHTLEKAAECLMVFKSHTLFSYSLQLVLMVNSL